MQNTNIKVRNVIDLANFFISVSFSHFDWFLFQYLATMTVVIDATAKIILLDNGFSATGTGFACRL